MPSIKKEVLRVAAYCRVSTAYERTTKRVRMEKAVGLLLESDMPVLEIARSVGYCGDGHFHQAFREMYGTTPGKMRRAIQKNAE
jgi:transcriptional regulator GlxA family with amidase domain